MALAAMTLRLLLSTLPLGVNCGLRGSDNSASDLAQLLSGRSPLLPAATPHEVAIAAASMQVDFYSFPLDGDGRIPSPHARELVQSHFERKVGWQLTGLERRGFLRQAAAIHQLSVFDGAPAAAQTALQRLEDPTEMLSLEQVGVLAVSIRHLARDGLLWQLAPELEEVGRSAVENLDRNTLGRALARYFAKTQAWTVAEASQLVHHSFHLYDHMQYASGNVHRNPFTAQTYTPEEAVRVFAIAVHDGAEVLQHGCLELQDHLAATAKDGMFSIVAHEATDDSDFSVSEGVEYLEAVGAMAPGSANVWLANYVAIPSNCAPRIGHVATCCANLCTPIISAVRRAVGTFEAEPGVIARLIEDAPSRFIETPRRLSPKLIRGLEETAAAHGGKVQLHSRAFDLWLHTAYPNECPFPSESIINSTYFTDHERWAAHIVASEAESAKHKRQRHHAAAQVADVNGTDLLAEEAGTMDILYATPKPGWTSLVSSARGFAVVLAMIGVLVSSWRTVAGVMQAAMRSGSNKHKVDIPR